MDNKTEYLKCIECENCFSAKKSQCKCPRCGSDDLFELKEIKSNTNWNYVNSCFRE